MEPDRLKSIANYLVEALSHNGYYIVYAKQNEKLATLLGLDLITRIRFGKSAVETELCGLILNNPEFFSFYGIKCIEEGRYITYCEEYIHFWSY